MCNFWHSWWSRAKAHTSCNGNVFVVFYSKFLHLLRGERYLEQNEIALSWRDYIGEPDHRTIMKPIDHFTLEQTSNCLRRGGNIVTHWNHCIIQRKFIPASILKPLTFTSLSCRSIKKLHIETQRLYNRVWSIDKGKIWLEIISIFRKRLISIPKLRLRIDIIYLQRNDTAKAPLNALYCLLCSISWLMIEKPSIRWMDRWLICFPRNMDLLPEIEIRTTEINISIAQRHFCASVYTKEMWNDASSPPDSLFGILVLQSSVCTTTDDIFMNFRMTKYILQLWGRLLLKGDIETIAGYSTLSDMFCLQQHTRSWIHEGIIVPQFPPGFHFRRSILVPFSDQMVEQTDLFPLLWTSFWLKMPALKPSAIEGLFTV